MKIGPNNILLPTAQAQYLITPELQERYATYDAYVLAIMRQVQTSWSSGGTSGPVEQKKTKQDFYPITSSRNAEVITLSERDASLFIDHLENPPEPNEALKTLFIGHNDTHNSTPEQKYAGVKIKKVKPYKRKEMKNASPFNRNCPNCLSTLKVNEVGVLECSKDRLGHWEREFLTYDRLTDEQKTKYLLTYEDTSVFFELYEKWSVVEEAGKRPLFDCGYTNKLFNPISKFRTTLPDPILVKRIERSLGKELTEQEKFGEVELWREGNRYFQDFRKGRAKVKIPVITYPTDLL